MVDPETFAFLTDLALNNRKAWVNDHRAERDDALRNFTGMAMTLHDYAADFDHFVADARIKPKQSHTKFFQDSRERSGPGLYRTGIDVFANAGSPTENFGYYVHVEHGNCHAGAALFQPSKQALARLQTRLVDDLEYFEKIVTDPEFLESFPDGIITRNPLTAVPDGFDADGPAAPYLKMVGLGCRKDLADEALIDDGAIDLVIETFRSAGSLVRFFD